ncbi:MAG: DUF3108 domain-containing protein [Bacteroidota bacterium]|nr:DUF3108 domain-containing protein [Bacteroidota bacterium]MDP4241303.1 DUF3108 domain-containing protein [Bacteroidota bacterium]MDP4287224.1 DUF3108 domain-containing protein [Bacteroidota bacterium]
MKKIKSYFMGLVAIATMFSIASATHAQAGRKDAFQTGEQLVYNVKYGFIKLGTLVVQTGAIANGKATAHMQFWTADVPFLNTKTGVTDQFDTRDLTLRSFEEHSQNGDEKTNKYMTYDPEAKSLTYSDDQIKNKVTTGIDPFDDALGLLFNMRAWSGAAGKKYLFHLRGKDGARPVTVQFTNQFSNEQVAALDDKEVRTRILQGNADMGSSSPLGANGAFTAYISDDAAAIPVRIDMSIAVGSISIVLDKVKRPDWTAAK